MLRGPLVAELDREGPDVETFSFAHQGKSWAAVLVRSDKPTAFLNRCPHWSLPLDDAHDDIWDGDMLVCSVHAAEFDPTSGTCVSGPCQGTRLHPLVAEVDGDSIRVFQAGLLTDLGMARS